MKISKCHLVKMIKHCGYASETINKTKIINEDRKLYLKLINGTDIIIERDGKIEYKQSYDKRTALSNFRIMSI